MMVSSYLFQGCTNIHLHSNLNHHHHSKSTFRTSRDYQSPDRWHPVDPTQASGFGLHILDHPKPPWSFSNLWETCQKKHAARPIDLLHKYLKMLNFYPKSDFCVSPSSFPLPDCHSKIPLVPQQLGNRELW